MTRITDTLHKDLCTFMIISRALLLRVRNVLDRSRRENHKTHFVCNIFLSDNRAMYGIIVKNKIEPDRRHDSIIRCMRIAFWTTRVTDTYSEYVILTSFRRQQWLRERVSVLRLYILCLCLYCHSRSILPKYIL
jgi:hypothetical protein